MQIDVAEDNSYTIPTRPVTRADPNQSLDLLSRLFRGLLFQNLQPLGVYFGSTRGLLGGPFYARKCEAHPLLKSDDNIKTLSLSTIAVNYPHLMETKFNFPIKEYKTYFEVLVRYGHRFNMQIYLVI